VLELYHLAPAAPSAPSLGAAAESLLARLRDSALTADELVRASGIDAGEGAAVLTALELAGQVTVEDGLYRAAI
jgi:predicted Rossmann fold nucleotide-binding protein DprA/Smf involved in DNA uptake